jgi:hypothetical protein
VTLKVNMYSHAATLHCTLSVAEALVLLLYRSFSTYALTHMYALQRLVADAEAAHTAEQHARVHFEGLWSHCNAEGIDDGGAALRAAAQQCDTHAVSKLLKERLRRAFNTD